MLCCFHIPHNLQFLPDKSYFLNCRLLSWIHIVQPNRKLSVMSFHWLSFAFLPILNFSLITWNMVILCKDPSENIGIYLIWSVLIQWLTKQNCMKFTFFFSSWNLKLVPVYLLEISYFTLFLSFLVRLQVQGIVISE